MCNSPTFTNKFISRIESTSQTSTLSPFPLKDLKYYNIFAFLLRAGKINRLGPFLYRCLKTLNKI
jgi:hypothetical protein